MRTNPGRTEVRSVRLPCHGGGQDDPSPVLQGGAGPTPDHRLGARPGGEAPRSDVLLHQARLDRRQILSAYACRWAIECTFENCKQLLGLEDPANRLPKAVERTAPMALILYSLVVVWFHQTGHGPSLPLPPLVPQEGRTVVRRHVDDPEAGQLRGENRETASETVPTENLARPAHRASQPRGLSRASAGDSGLPQRITKDSREGIHPPGRSRSVTEIKRYLNLLMRVRPIPNSRNPNLGDRQAVA